MREERWQEVESTWGMFTADEVESLVEAHPLGVASVMRCGQERFPTFQFVTDADGGPMLGPAWVRLRDLLSPAGWSDENLLIWTASPNSYVDGRSPAEQIRDHPDDVTDALAYAVDTAILGQRWSWQ